MKSIIIFLFTFSILSASNPAPYAQLGDELYNSLDKYKSISKELPQMDETLKAYISEVQETKKMGFELENNPKLSKKYLYKLRELDRKREIILVKLNAKLYDSMDMKDVDTFKKIVRSGLLDLEKVEDDIVPFYKKYFKSGSIREIESMLQKEKLYKNSKRAENREYRKSVERRRIQRMREASENADKSLEAELDKEIEHKRQEIYSMMEDELIR
jgi:hypothetical protein